MTTKDPHGWTTASLAAIPRLDSGLDTTSGLVLVYSRLWEHLPSAVPFSNEVTTIGREADNTLSIAEPAVSRYHARTEKRADGDWIVDLGSTNGTVVSGKRVSAQRLIEHDVVRIGDTLFRYASSGVFGYGAYRLNGEVVENARPVQHGIKDTLLVGGYQLDRVLERITKVAPTELSVVIHGESGTGKELVARELHRQSRRPGPFQAINCAALPANLIESELFGYKKGAFTGAATDKTGLVQAADGGTLFLDEVGDMPLPAQAKLLRVLQEREVLPIGSTTPTHVNVRIACATHRDLDTYVAEHRFRGDLLARLRECLIELPPLRHRREDLFLLTRHFLEAAGRSTTEISFAYMLGLAHYDWPYNVRELESAIKLSLALTEGPCLDVNHLPAGIARVLEELGNKRVSRVQVQDPPSADNTPAVVGGRRGTPSEEELRSLLAEHDGNIAAVGRILGKERMQIHRWLKRYDINIDDYRR